MRGACGRWTVVAALTWALAACSTDFDLGLFDDPAEAEAKAKAEEALLPPKRPVVRIEDLELGRLHSGYMLNAIGVAPGLGYYQPELKVRYGGRTGPDGFVEYDFLVRPPEDAGRGADAPITARMARAHIEITPQILRTARGVRVWSARDSVEGRF